MNRGPVLVFSVAVVVVVGLGCSGSSTIVDQGAADVAAADAADLRDLNSIDQLSLKWQPCSTAQWPAGTPLPSKQVQCTTMAVPFDHEAPAGKTFTLSVARERSKNPTGKAMFYLAGGPGGTAVALAGVIPSYYTKLLDTFDLVYVDQRGTWSSGELGCSAGFPQTAQDWKDCATEHTDKDLNHYLTLDAAHDLELVRKALGYSTIHVIGGSYGTRVALEFMRQHPTSVAAVVLDGVAPPDADVFGDWVLAVTRGLELLVKECHQSSACLNVSPNLAADLETRRLALKATPRKITVGGQVYYENDALFGVFLYLCLDYPILRYAIPRAIHQAVNGNNALWDKLLSQVYGAPVQGLSLFPSPGPSFGPPPAPSRPRWHRGWGSGDAPGTMALVSCAEWFPNSGGLQALEALRTQQPLADDFMLDMARSCSSWKVNPLSAALRAPVTSDLKVLLLSGAIDIHTPPANGDRAIKTLTAGTHVIIPYAGHTSASACVAGITQAFLTSNGDMKAVDTSCLKALSQPPW